MAASNKERLTTFIKRVWNEGEEAAVEEFVAATYTVSHDPGDPWHGKKLDRRGYRERLRLSRAPFPDQAFTIVRIVEEEDAVVITWSWTATHLGDIPGFPATGKPIEMTGVTLYTFDENQQITGHWQIADRLGVYQQLREAVRGD